MSWTLNAKHGAEGRRYHVESEGAEVGTLIVLSTPGVRVEVWSVEVYPQYRGEGLGKRIMNLAEHIARRDSAPEVWLRVDKGNARARGLYESLGYRVTAERDEDVEMTKELR